MDFRMSAEEKEVRETGWIRGYISWAIRSGNAWSISLLPFLWFLRLLSE